MKRRADSISDAAIKATPHITLPAGTPMQLRGDWPLSGGLHALIVAVPADTVIEIGDPK